jgi:hypothetical protein
MHSSGAIPQEAWSKSKNIHDHLAANQYSTNQEGYENQNYHLILIYPDKLH